jgi:hypothetical protein
MRRRIEAVNNVVGELCERGALKEEIVPDLT